MKFYDYKWMLQRALAQVPKSDKLEDKKFEWPKADVLIQGSKTIVRNFGDVASFLQRKPSHLVKFLSRELGSPGNRDGKRLFFSGRFNYNLVNTKLASYVKEFVICPSCGRHETVLMKQDRIDIMKCDACGALNPMRTIK